MILLNEMLMKMHAARWIFLFTLWVVCVSSNDEESCEDLGEFCSISRLSISLGSSVLLPCTARPTSSNWVTWSHFPKGEMVQLSPLGHVKYQDPRNGRVKTFPFQGLEGNYSIRIDDLGLTDLGCYSCIQGENCVQVVLVEVGTRRDMQTIYICVSVAALLLLCVGGYTCKKCIGTKR
ncbi:unnamed protein product [Oreochromis niloticus]|nr:unnamed protein product [Mustela putorius furo]